MFIKALTAQAQRYIDLYGNEWFVSSQPLDDVYSYDSILLKTKTGNMAWFHKKDIEMVIPNKVKMILPKKKTKKEVV